MPVIEIEVDDTGAPVKVPESVQKLIDKAFGQGQAKGTDETSARLKKEIDTLKAGSSLSPLEREQLKTLELEHSKLTEQLALRDKNYEAAQEARDKRHLKELDERKAELAASQAEIAKRTTRIQELTRKEVRAAAVIAGARDESLPELELLLGSRIGLDDGLQAFVTDAQDPGKPLLGKDGKAVSIEGFVAQYVADHPHHKAPAGGRGGGARGGRSLSGTQGPVTEKDQTFERVSESPTLHNVAAAMALIGR